MRKGWFTIPGVQHGDRTAAEQLKGLDAALKEAAGKTVCDLGSAEGLISIAFAKAGAASVWACDVLHDHISEALRQARGLPCTFEVRDLNALVADPAADLGSFDVVLALAIIHKLAEPARALELAARAARSLLVLRLPIHARNGVFASKYRPETKCDVPRVLKACGFVLELTQDGPRREPVQYWRRDGDR